MSELQQEHGLIAVATVVRTYGSTPMNIGHKMVVLPGGRIEGTIGGGPVEKEVVELALELLSKGGFVYKEFRLLPKEENGVGTQCGGNMDVFIEVTGSPNFLLICGGGHIGLALTKMAQVLDFQVAVVDDREEYASQERFPGARVFHCDFDEETLLGLATPETSVVIVTHGHGNDKKCLNILLKSDAGYIGMIGSRRKVLKLKEQLVEEGVDQESLDRVYAPIGLDIGAETPAEIAVSILSEIINVKKRGTPSSLGMGRRDGGGA